MTRETKMSAPGGKSRAAMHELLAAFESFKDANDRRLSEIERKRAADPLLEEKINRIDTALHTAQSRLDRIAIEAGRPALGAGGGAQRGQGGVCPFPAHRGRRAPRRGQGAERGIARRWRPCRPARDRGADHRQGARGQPDPRHRQRAPDRGGRVQEAGESRWGERGLGGRNRGAARDRHLHPGADRVSRRRALRHAPPPRRPCWTTPWSIWRNGWPTRCATCSPRLKARRSSMATGLTSRAAS